MATTSPTTKRTPAHQLSLLDGHGRDADRRTWHLPHVPGLSAQERQRSIRRLVELQVGDGLRVTTEDAAVEAVLLAVTRDSKIVGQVASGRILVLDIANASLVVV